MSSETGGTSAGAGSGTFDVDRATLAAAEPDVEFAVARLIDQGRDITDRELLLAGVVEVLGGGPLNQVELLHKLNALWPAAGVTEARLNAALNVGQKGNLVCRAAALDSEELWTLTRTGSSEVQATASWADDMYGRAARQVREKALEAFGRDPGDEQAVLWAKALRRAVLAGIRNGRSVYEGSVDALDAASLTPHGIDKNAVFAALDRWSTTPEISSFLQVCVLSALDPTDTFGTELVTNVVTACLLHAAVARRDVAGAADKLGTLRGQRMVLDTPVLLQLMGPLATATPVQQALKAAVAAGVNVVVAEHTLEELAQALEHVAETDSANIAAISADRHTAEEMGRLVDGEVLGIFASALSDGRAKDWDDFTQFARVGLPAELATLGVRRREHGNHDRGVVRACHDALSTTLRERGRHRSKANVASDAESMAMVWRKRRRDARDVTVRSSWPGAWLITSDRTIAPAMRSLDSQNQWPFTLSVAQLTILLTRCQEVPSVVELSEAAATLVAHEASESIACRYPPNVAIELAHAIASGVDGREYDVRVAQTMPLHDLLADAETRDPAVVTSRVLGERQRRHDEAIKFQRQQLTESTRQAEHAAERARGDAEAERKTAAALEVELRREREERARVEAAREASDRDRDQQAAAARRARVRDGVLVVHLVLAIVGAFVFMPLCVGSLLSGALFWERSRGWVHGADQGASAALMAVAVGTSPDLIALIVWLWPHLT